MQNYKIMCNILKHVPYTINVLKLEIYNECVNAFKEWYTPSITFINKYFKNTEYNKTKTKL